MKGIHLYSEAKRRSEECRRFEWVELCTLLVAQRCKQSKCICESRQ